MKAIEVKVRGVGEVRGYLEFLCVYPGLLVWFAANFSGKCYAAALTCPLFFLRLKTVRVMNPGETVQTEPKGQLRKTLRQKYRFLTNLRKVPALYGIIHGGTPKRQFPQRKESFRLRTEPP